METMELTMFYSDKVCAIIFDDDGKVYDHAWSWEAAQNYALHEGMRIIAVEDDGYMTKQDIQELCDSDRASYLDCWGELLG